MSDAFGIITSAQAFLRETPETGRMPEITDELFSGWAVRILKEAADGQDSGSAPFAPADAGSVRIEKTSDAEYVRTERPAVETPGNQTKKLTWLMVETSYGYRGYLDAGQIRRTDLTFLKNREGDPAVRMVALPALDVLSEPRVQGLPREVLLKGALVELITVPGHTGTEEKTGAVPDVSGLQNCSGSQPGRLPEGWLNIRTASGTEGYVPEKSLMPRPDTDGYFFAEVSTEPENTSFFHDRKEEICRTRSETDLRHAVTDSAMKYLGTQYRWGGKSSQGLDCSGLTFMSYFLNGILIFRDAGIRPQYPVHSISADRLGPADLIFFPGHVAMYLGEGRFIHSTAFRATPCVTINSLNPADSLYRPDLAASVTGYGSIFL